MMSVAECIDIWRRAASRGVFPHQFSWVLELPWRRVVLSPGALVARLPLRPEAVVLELGAGSGYYSVEAARRIPRGWLHLLDLQPEMLGRCRMKCASAGLANVALTVADGAALPFTGRSFDLAYMVTVLGEVRDLDACIRNIHRVLKPGGALSVSEHLPDPEFIALNTLRRRIEPAGFVFEGSHGSRFAYTANFRAS
jgi:ubiquinone/menaquinone biosynthesis C-methylase UbiE